MRRCPGAGGSDAPAPPAVWQNLSAPGSPAKLPGATAFQEPRRPVCVCVGGGSSTESFWVRRGGEAVGLYPQVRGCGTSRGESLIDRGEGTIHQGPAVPAFQPPPLHPGRLPSAEKAGAGGGARGEPVSPGLWVASSWLPLARERLSSPDLPLSALDSLPDPSPPLRASVAGARISPQPSPAQPSALT